ncbi:MAG: helix-turn-helix domain-containing protein [Synergistaceae bacterium]|nr:helix-turn-helix domain-containing protein [Synergistaceae bacterium]MBR0081089.1 helix-turn-helix domain-containing protein [Synergistaceae bacterium]
MKKSRKRFMGNDRALGNALRHFRELSGLTQTEVADITELSQSTISRFEDGDNWPCKETTFRLCYVYGITLLDLFDFVIDDLRNLPSWALEIHVVNLEQEKKDEITEND